MTALSMTSLPLLQSAIIRFIESSQVLQSAEGMTDAIMIVL